MGTKYISKYRTMLLFCAEFTALIGVLVMLGWLLGSQTLKSIHPRFAPMKITTAFCFILLGVSGILQFKTKAINNFMPRALAVLVAVTGLLSLIQVVANTFYTDTIFIADNLALLHGKVSTRMSPPTSFCLIIAGTALLLIKSEKKIYIMATQYMLHCITLIAAIALLGYIFGIPDIYRYTFANSMALHTAFTFLVFSVGASLANPYCGITALFTGPHIGNVMARKLFTWIIPSVIIICYIRMLLYKYNVLSLQVGLALLTISFLLISLVSVWKTSKTLNEIDEKEKHFEENLRMGIEAAPYALILSNAHGEIIHVNYQAERIFKYDRDELIGADCKLVLPDEIMGSLSEKRKKFYKDLKVISYPLEDGMHCRRKDGSRFPAELVISPVITSGGTLALTSVIDLTLRVENERLAQEHLAELQHKTQEMEQFNYIASHDLQEPLRTVANYIMLLQEDYPENVTPEIKDHLLVMEQAVTRMSRLIRTLLDFGRLGRDKKLVCADCNSIVKDVITDLSSLIRSTGTTITLNDRLPVLYAYDIELHQLFQNLINNAIKFRKKDMPPNIELGCRAINGFYEVYVADNGIGINPKHFESIFHIFQRVNSQEEYEGYGVGLANCKKIVEMHGGKIWVESEYEKGSTFKFTLINFKP